MNKLLVRSLVLGTGLAAAGVMVAASATAHAAPYKIKAGTTTSGTTSVTATTTAVNFKDTTSGVTLTCTASKLTGTLKLGTLSTGTAVATINGSTASFTGCTGPAGLKFNVAGSGTWQIDISDTTNGVTTGKVSKIVANVTSVTGGPTCNFQVGSNTGSFTGTVTPGSTPGTFTNSTQILAGTATNPGALGLWNVHGSGSTTYCVSPSILKQSDKASFQANYKLTAAAGAISIT